MKYLKCIFRNTVSLAIMVVLSVSATAQNYSGLQNKDLPQENIGEALVGSILGAIFDSELSGDIEKVKVLDDREISLTVSIKYWGFKNGGFLQMSLGDQNLVPLKGFTPQTTALTPDQNQVELKIQLDPKSYEENQTFVAPRLVIVVSKSADVSQGVKRVYKLNKKFTNPITAENIIIPVALTPVGSAASLPVSLPSENPAIPRTNVYKAIKDKSLYLHSAVLATPNQPAVAERKLVKPTLTGESVLKARPNVRDHRTPVTDHRAPVRDHRSPVRDHRTPADRTTPDRTGPADQPAPVSTEPEGPDNKPLSFWGDFIYSDVDFESQMDITNVSLNIYPDKNPNSGVFYYLPIAYDIRYDAEKGFAFNVDYGTSRGEETESRVRMSGTLSSGISLYEIQFIKNLMETYKKQNPGLELERPLPLPVSETPEITLGDELKNFGIATVNINNVNSITDPIEFSWQTDGTTAAELENLLRVNSGIIGKMKMKVAGDNLPVQEIPVRIRLIDENTFGRFGRTPDEMRNKTWRNETPFPVRLKYVHYMVIDKTRGGKESPIIYSWDLGNQEIQPGNQVKFDMKTIPAWLDNYKGKQARIWIEYSVVESCTVCNEKVFSSIISSTSRPQLSDVVFRVIDFFESHDIAYMDVEIKSLQGDPNGRVETTFPLLHITQDKTDYAAGKIYVPAGSTPAFDYRVTVVTNNGAEMKSDWISRTSTNVPFGSYQLEELFPSLKK